MVRTLRAVIAITALMAGSAAPARAAGPLDALAYEIRTVFDGPTGEVVTQQPAILLVPSAIDVDHDLTTGTAGADVAVQLTIDAGRATLRATKLPGAPTHLPLSVEAVLADPRGGSTYAVAFGYDARADTAPDVYDASIALVGARRVGSFTLDVRTAGAGRTIGVTAAVFERADDGTRRDPVDARFDLSPVPAVSHVGVLFGSDLGVQQSSVDIVVDTPTRVTAVARDVRGTSETRAELVVDVLPNSVSLLLTDTADGRRTWSYRATDRIAAIDLRVLERSAGSVDRELALRLEDMPRSATLVQTSPTHAVFQAESPIGALEVGAAEGGAVKGLDEQGAYVYADDREGVSSLSARVLGLSRLEVETSDPFMIDASLASGPMHVVVYDGTLSIDALVRDLPDRVRLAFSTQTQTVSYAGSAPIGELSVEASDPSGLVDRATRLSLLARAIPTTLELSFSGSGGAVRIDASGQMLGLLEVLVTSGPIERLDPSVDGVMLRDLADRYLLFARVTGLRAITASLGPPPDITLETTGGRIFRADLERRTGSKIEYVRATLDRLVPSVRVRFVEGPRREQIIYTASAPTNRLTIDTNSGDRWNLHATIGGPLPASVSFCSSDDAWCTGSSRQADAGAFKLTASEHTTIDVFDCVRPLSSSCARGSASEFTAVDSLRVRHAVFDADSNDPVGYSGHIFLDTDNHELTGHIRNENGSGGGFDATFPGGFRAQDRLGRWTLWGIDKDKSGSISCPSGTGLSVRVFGIWVGVTSYLC